MSQKLDRKRLLDCRKSLGLSQVEAAKRMQMSQPAYARYESGVDCQVLLTPHFNT